MFSGGPIQWASTGKQTAEIVVVAEFCQVVQWTDRLLNDFWLNGPKPIRNYK